MSENTNTPEAAAVPPPAKTNSITKIEAVRQAMEKLVKDASRTDIQAYVKEHFGYEMSLDHITDCKKKILKKTKAKKPAAAKAAPDAPKPAAAKPAAPKPVAAKTAVAKATTPKAAPAAAGNGNGKTLKVVSLTDLESVKGLVNRMGTDQLRSLIDLLAK